MSELLCDTKTNVQKLKAKLDSFGGTLGGITLGEKSSSIEEICGQILAAIDAIEAGDFDVDTNSAD